ncbi:MAG: hypothetical protein R6V28_16025 [Nitriliruptoraceae bacterium]
MSFGVAIFLGFLLLATQVMVHLYATSTVTAVAFDEARRASTEGGRCEGVEARVIERLGEWGRRPGVRVTCAAGTPPQPGSAGVPTTVRITGPSPARSLSIFGNRAIVRVDRSASFLTEREVAR